MVIVQVDYLIFRRVGYHFQLFGNEFDGRCLGAGDAAGGDKYIAYHAIEGSAEDGVIHLVLGQRHNAFRLGHISSNQSEVFVGEGVFGQLQIHFSLPDTSSQLSQNRLIRVGLQVVA